MSYTILRPKTHEEWMEARTQGLGSSEIGTILGLNPFETPYQLWRRKKGIDPPKEENFAMKAGHYLEDAVSLFYQDETGNQIIKASKGDWLVVDKERPYLRVSPDRTFWIPGEKKNNDNKAILECKTTQMEIDGGNIPQHWFCQLQYQLGVMGYRRGALAWLTMGRKFDYKDFAFDAEFYSFIVENVARFWKDCIIGGIEPPLSNVDDVLLKNPKEIKGKMVEADSELLQDCAELKEIKSRLKEIETRKKEIESRVKIAIGDAEAMVTEKNGDHIVLASWKASKPSMKFNEKAFKEDHPDLYKEYLVETPGTRRFLLK